MRQKLDCIAVLKALGEINRMRILRFLLNESHNVGEIAEEVGVSPYNASKHLRILREAGLVATSRDGKNRYYTLAEGLRKHMRDNGNELNLACCTFRFDELPR
jgi:DNA-binding transcriptional ArsR family regulator